MASLLIDGNLPSTGSSIGERSADVTSAEVRPIERTLSKAGSHRSEEHYEFVAIAAIVALLAVPAALAATPTLVGTVGPGFTITLTKGGKKVSKLKAGTYVFKIADKASDHNFHLKGPGVDKKTSVGAKVNVTWKLKLKPGKYPSSVTRTSRS